MKKRQVQPGYPCGGGVAYTFKSKKGKAKTQGQRDEEGAAGLSSFFSHPWLYLPLIGSQPH